MQVDTVNPTKGNWFSYIINNHIIIVTIIVSNQTNHIHSKEKYSIHQYNLIRMHCVSISILYTQVPHLSSLLALYKKHVLGHAEYV